MRSLIFILILATSFVVTVKSNADLQIDLLEPKGFRVIWKNAVGIRSAGIGGSIWFKPYGADENEKYSGTMIRQSNGWWVYQNLTTNLSPGDGIFYVIARVNEGNTEVATDDFILDLYTVPDNATRVHV